MIKVQKILEAPKRPVAEASDDPKLKVTVKSSNQNGTWRLHTPKTSKRRRMIGLEG